MWLSIVLKNICENQLTFRVATFNLHQGIKRWEERRELIVEQFGALRPDIMALNEISVPLQNGRWLWHEVSERFHIKYSYLQQNKAGAFISEEEAQGLLTLFPILETGHFEYLARGRVAQVARLEIEGQPVDVYVTHLHHVKDEDGLRQYEVQRLFQWIESRSDVKTCIVCGDFNAPPDSPSIQLVPKHFRPVQLSPTAPTPIAKFDDLPLESESSSLSLCLDYIWITRDLIIKESGLCFNQPSAKDPSLWPSDHVGVWADLMFA